MNSLDSKYCAFCGMEVSLVDDHSVCLNHDDILILFRDDEYDMIMDEYEISVNHKNKEMTLSIHEHEYENESCDISPVYDYFSYGRQVMKVDIDKLITPEEFCATLKRLKKMIPFS